jgi:hypothetical protein
MDKIMDKTLGKNISDKVLIPISEKIKKLFPNNECYFIGTSCIKNVEKSDIDFIVLFNEPIRYDAFLDYKIKISEIDNRLQMMPCFAEHQKDLKDLPYISMQDITDRKLLNKEDYTEDEYAGLKKNMYKHLWKKRRFHRAMIRDKKE